MSTLPAKPNRRAVSYRLEPAYLDLLGRLRDELGLTTDTDVIRFALRALEREHLNEGDAKKIRKKE